MEYPPRNPFSGDSFPDDSLPTDELDTLFEQLPQLEPPPSLIARILAKVSCLPPPRHCPPEELGDTTNPPLLSLTLFIAHV